MRPWPRASPYVFASMRSLGSGLLKIRWQVLGSYINTSFANEGPKIARFRRNRAPCAGRRVIWPPNLPLDADIYAIGECAAWNNQVFGLVAPGYDMARVVARHMLGEDAAFRGAAGGRAFMSTNPEAVRWCTSRSAVIRASYRRHGLPASAPDSAVQMTGHRRFRPAWQGEAVSIVKIATYSLRSKPNPPTSSAIFDLVRMIRRPSLMAAK